MDETLRAALYGRVSSQRQAEELTIASQVAAIRQRVAQDGLRVAEELCFLDEGYSGSTLVRPALERLRDVAYYGGIDRLYVHSPDRLARRYPYQVLLLEEFQKLDVEVVFLQGDRERVSPDGELFLQMQGIIAEYERAKILERTRRGRRFAARQGKVSALGHAPYGYRYVTRREGEGEARYDIVAEQARWVRAMFTWVGLEGLSLGAVTRRLAEQGVPTATGKTRWDRATIHGILRQPAYQGTACYGKTRLVPRETGGRAKRGDPPTARRDKVQRDAPPEEQETVRVPALVSAELFAAVGARLEENRRRQRERATGSEFLLGGLLVCRRCGSAYCGRRSRRAKSSQPYVYYRCLGSDKYRHGGEAICANPSLPGERMEAAVWSEVRALLEDPERLRQELQRRLDRATEHGVSTPDADKVVQRLKTRIARLIDLYENDWLEKREFERRMGPLRAQLQREEEALAARREDLARDEELRLVVDHFETFAQQIHAGLADADLATQRKLLRLLVARIEIDLEEIHIVYKVHPLPFAPGPASRGLLQDCLQFRATASRLRSLKAPASTSRCQAAEVLPGKQMRARA